MKKAFLIIGPIVSWLFFSLVFIIILPRLIFKKFFVWWVIVILFFFSFLLILSVTLLLYYFLGIFEGEVFSDKEETKEQVVKEVDPRTIRKYIIDYFMKDPSNPVNLEVVDYSMSGIRSVGSGQKTEIYIDKLRDKTYNKLVYYYVAVRVNDLTKISYETRKYHPSQTEEDALVRKICNDLAESPDKKIETEMKVIQTPWGEERIKIDRIPQEIFNSRREKQLEDF